MRNVKIVQKRLWISVVTRHRWLNLVRGSRTEEGGRHSKKSEGKDGKDAKVLHLGLFCFVSCRCILFRSVIRTDELSRQWPVKALDPPVCHSLSGGETEGILSSGVPRIPYTGMWHPLFPKTPYCRSHPPAADHERIVSKFLAFRLENSLFVIFAPIVFVPKEHDRFGGKSVVLLLLFVRACSRDATRRLVVVPPPPRFRTKRNLQEGLSARMTLRMNPKVGHRVLILVS